MWNLIERNECRKRILSSRCRCFDVPEVLAQTIIFKGCHQHSLEGCTLFFLSSYLPPPALLLPDLWHSRAVWPWAPVSFPKRVWENISVCKSSVFTWDLMWCHQQGAPQATQVMTVFIFKQGLYVTSFPTWKCSECSGFIFSTTKIRFFVQCSRSLNGGRGLFPIHAQLPLLRGEHQPWGPSAGSSAQVCKECQHFCFSMEQPETLPCSCHPLGCEEWAGSAVPAPPLGFQRVLFVPACCGIRELLQPLSLSEGRRREPH